MRIIQTRSNVWELEYDNGQRVLPGDHVTDNNDITALFRGIADGHVELSELSDAHFEESPAARVPIGEFLDKYMPNHERYGQASPIGIVRDHPSHDEDLRSKSVVDRGSREIKVRWAKETIGLVTVQLNEAYAQFEIRSDGFTIPGGLSRAAERLGEVLQCLGIASNLDDEIPF